VVRLNRIDSTENQLASNTHTFIRLQTQQKDTVKFALLPLKNLMWFSCPPVILKLQRKITPASHKMRTECPLVFHVGCSLGNGVWYRDEPRYKVSIPEQFQGAYRRTQVNFCSSFRSQVPAVQMYSPSALQV
jgi:hypothetical protein